MQQQTSQLPLTLRIPALADAVRSTRAMKEQYEQEEAHLMDELAQAEAQVLGGEGKAEGAQLSGLIKQGDNPYAGAPASDNPEGDRVDPVSGKSSGDAGHGGSASPHSKAHHK